MEGVVSSDDGIPIAYEVRGSGAPAIVFVHGWSCDRSYWTAQLASFSRRHRTVSLDLAGHGGSGGGRTDWSMAAFGRDVVAVLDRLALRDVVLVGHSMGGDVVTEAAHDLGDRVRGVVWVDTYRSLGSPRAPAQVDDIIERFRSDYPGEIRRVIGSMLRPDGDPALAAAILDDMAAAPVEVALDALRHSISNDGPILDRLATLRAPVVAIHPGEPQDVDGSLGRFGVSTVTMPGVGHFPMLEDPAGFDRVLAGVIATFR